MAEGKFELIAVDGRPVTEPHLLGRFTVDPVTGLLEHGEPDQLFLSAGGRRFEPVSWTNGWFLDERGGQTSDPYDWGLSAMFRDVNDDGAPDLYVCNDFQSEDRFWINNGAGKFRAMAPGALRQTSLFSMGVDFADLDRDGLDEFFVADMLSRQHVRRQTQVLGQRPGEQLKKAREDRPQYSRNTLFWNRGDGIYAEIAQFSGLHASEWSWCPVFIDVDLDGFEDLLVTAGHERDAQDSDLAREIDRAKRIEKASFRQWIQLRRKYPKIAAPIIAFQNRRDLTFDFVSPQWGFTHTNVSQGIALADLDNDGDLDAAVNTLNGPALLYRNNSPAPRVGIRLKGGSGNTRGVGAKIELLGGAVPKQSQEMIAGGRYLSSDDFMRVFAPGASQKASVRVRWRSGRVSVIQDVPANSIIEVSEEASELAAERPVEANSPLFINLSGKLARSHVDPPFDDFQRQPLLPRSFSYGGPGVSWFDLDGDGWEELIIGSGRSGRIAVFGNTNGSLHLRETGGLFAPGTRDRTTILGIQQEGARRLLIGSANYEDGLTNGPAVREYHAANGKMNDSFPGFTSSTGPLAAGDFDLDGDLDLFVGGRVIAGQFPRPASSAIFRNEHGTYVLDEKASGRFAEIGMVSAAIWCDLTADARSELALACDGGPIRVFSFASGYPREISAEMGLAQLTGWWQSLAAGDFNSDGRMDLVAGNWGLNNQYREYAEHYRLYYPAAGFSGTIPLIEASYDQQLGKIVPRHDLELLAAAFPHLREKYKSFAAFSTASITDILGDQLANFRALTVRTLASTLFLNVSNRFRAEALPFAAQISPVFGLAVGDVDADGHVDLFLAQNFFAVGQNTSRHDAGLGTLLLGRGDGTFESLPPRRSGVAISGEGRGAAFCDFDHDGRLDLAVGVNSAPTRLYLNNAPSHGLRVSLRGLEKNPHAVGATVRPVLTGDSLGPASQVFAGEGYWSQNASTLILGRVNDLQAIQVLWPDGERQTVNVPHGAREVVIRRSAGE